MSKRQSRENMRVHPHQIALVLPGEEWREVVGFPGYFVSNVGRVCGVDRIVQRSGSTRNAGEILRRGQMLKPGVYPSGHHYVLLGRGNHKLVHVAVLEAFVGPRPEGHDALHYDDVAGNNILTNLRWGTRSENLHDAVRNGKVAVGEGKPQAKLTEDRVRWIRANSQFSMNSLAMQLGVSCAAVKQVLDGVTWKHVI